MTPDRLLRAIALALLPAVPACAAPEAPLRPGVPLEVRGERLEPYGAREVCARLAEGDRLDYAFTTLAPVSFNIHYHEGNAVLMPVTRDGATSDSGVFRAAVPQDYCLMWEAGAEGTPLDFRVKLLPARP